MSDLPFERLLKISKAIFSDLSAAELDLLRDSARTYHSNELQMGSVTETKPEPIIRAELIRELCINQAAKQCLGPHGVKVLEKTIIGSLDLNSTHIEVPLLFDQCTFIGSIDISDANTASLSFLRTYCDSFVGAHIEVNGSLVLSGLQTPGPVNLRRAKINGDLDLKGAQLKPTIPEGRHESDQLPRDTALDLDLADIGGTVYLCDGFHSHGQVSLKGVNAYGNLNCRNGTFENRCELLGEDEETYAFVANQSTILGNVFLTNGFRADGHVMIVEAEVRGDFNCSGGSFVHPCGNGHAMSLDRTHIRGNAYFRDGFRSAGQVRLIGTLIDGDLICTDGTFFCAEDNSSEGNVAINALQARIMGSALLCEEILRGPDNTYQSATQNRSKVRHFATNGLVVLDAASIGSDLNFGFAGFFANHQGPNGLQAQKAKIGDVFRWVSVQCNNSTWMDLQYSEARHIDVSDSSSWPYPGNLNVDGCNFTSIRLPYLRRSAIRWMELQQNHRRTLPLLSSDTGKENRGCCNDEAKILYNEQDRHFHPQPYEQLAQVLNRMGEQNQARSVLVAKGDAKHQASRVRLKKERPWLYWSLLPFWETLHQIYKLTVGFGYQPFLALVWACLIFASGVGLFYVGYDRQLIVPTDPDACTMFVTSGDSDTRDVPAYHPRFNPFFYALDIFVPGIELDQEQGWRPTHAAKGAQTAEDYCRSAGDITKLGPLEAILFYYDSIAVIAGWILIALGLLGPKGVLRRT